ncbi:hypothetical protein PF005_g22015 [Phytophthora fragariae]|uniref:Uncharacterized protein n=2 Tax=Phytophthora fragariae TaxID=53985 RepID=A0A6A3WK80_9STRA|nr:hypothetical protein PF007_g27432 [Phytophthora fragariae]KAE9090772.1 hypothetical protein PF006_g25076 [Phytophthora fragariae]KAE9176094.1 hypothetical protein PF004_g26194 [Phytophthora fragariae]KAE9183617.1 hypothetical protein PF005_g22015 [Phytophthora fragariae]KAE9275646.1 hypothetical protein PF001_g26487 [Phytophthora fragariae]
MLTGIYFQGALDWLGEDRPVHTCFYRENLVEMLVRMMFWNKLNDSYWPKYVPERYYLAAEARLDDLVEQGIRPPFWGELVPSAVLDAKVLLEESGSEQDEASEESAWSDTGKESSEDDPDNMKVSISAENSSHQRKRSSSPVSVPDQPPAKRSRRDTRHSSRSPLAQKEYYELMADEKTVVEIPRDGVTSMRCHGVRVKHSDPSSTKESQTPGFPAYTPNRHDLDLLKARFDPDVFHAFLMAELPWQNMYADRVKELYFHRLDDLSETEISFLEMDNFMNGNSRAFWTALDWVIFLQGDPGSMASKIYTRRRKGQESVSRRMATLVKRYLKKGVRASLLQ